MAQSFGHLWQCQAETAQVFECVHPDILRLRRAFYQPMPERTALISSPSVVSPVQPRP